MSNVPLSLLLFLLTIMATLSPSFLSDCTILVRACARDGVLCLLTMDGRLATEALLNQREHELVEVVERVPTAAFHVCVCLGGGRGGGIIHVFSLMYMYMYRPQNRRKQGHGNP